LASFAAKKRGGKVPPTKTCATPNSHSSPLLFSHSSPRSSRQTLGLEPFGAGEEEEGQTRAREEEKGKREERKKSLFVAPPIEGKQLSRRTNKINPHALTCPLPGQAAPERDVGQHAGEGRREGHERGCVERHLEFREREWGVF